MIKFVYPLSSDIGRRTAAWRTFRDFCDGAQVSPQRTKLREEAFDCNTPLLDTEGVPFTRKARLYTFTFHLDEERAAELLKVLTGSAHRHVRQLTSQLVLILRDDKLALDERY